MASGKRKTGTDAAAQTQDLPAAPPALPLEETASDSTPREAVVVASVGPGESASAIVTGDGAGDALEPPKAEPVKLPSGTRKYSVWPHGELQRDGVTHKPGDVLTLPAQVGDAIVCLEPVTE